jgi:hypothetical protein
MIDGFCACGGPITRSVHVPERPQDSELCAACWYNQHNPATPLLTLDDLDSPWLEHAWADWLVGRLVDWHGHVVPIVLCNDGALRLEVTLRCRCGAESPPFYAGRGLHNGAWPYIYDKSGEYLACIRDQEWRCGTCADG